MGVPGSSIMMHRNKAVANGLRDGQNRRYKLDPSVGAELRYRSVVLSDA